MYYPQHPEKKQRNIRLNLPQSWGVLDETSSDGLSDDESVTTIVSVVVVLAVVAVVLAVVLAVAVFSCNNKISSSFSSIENIDAFLLSLLKSIIDSIMCLTIPVFTSPCK